MFKGVRRRHYMLAGSAAALALAAPVPALAQQQTFQFNIPAQSLDSALRAFARVSRQQILFDRSLVRGRIAPALSGSFSAPQAIERLLAGSGLRARLTNGGSWVVSALGEAEAGGAAANDESADFARAGVAEILVVGSRSQNADIRRTEDDTQPYMVFTREQVERSGSLSVEDFIRRRVTAQAASTSNAQLSNSPVGNLSSIDLRGLGADETLVLIDGRRVASVGFAGTALQPDLNGIPLAAIERIEVLPSSASGIYGGGATGGVINVVLRRDYRGGEIRLSYGDVFEGSASTRRLDFSAGLGLEQGRTSIMFSGSLSRSSPLTAGERDFRVRGLARALANNPALLRSGSFAPPLASTPNIAASPVFNPATGQSSRPDLVLDDGTPLGSPVTYAPDGYRGFQLDGVAPLLANLGHYNLELADTGLFGGARSALVNAPSTDSFNLTIRRRFSDAVDAFVELSSYTNRGRQLTAAGGGTFTVAANSPNNPFRQNIQVTSSIVGRDDIVTTSLRSRRLVAGVTWTISDSWRAAVDYALDRNRIRTNGTLTENFSLKSASARSGVLDLLRDGATPGFDLDSLYGARIAYGPVTNRADALALRLSGTLFEIWGGPVALTALGERRTMVLPEFRSTSPGVVNIYPERSQRVLSAYGEARIPFVSDRNRMPGIELLELQVAARHDDYRTRGANFYFELGGVPSAAPAFASNRFSSTDLTVGLRYQPVRGITFRGSYATGFLPPAVDQLVPDAPATIPASFQTDPRRGNEPLGLVTILGGGNPDLAPEQSRSLSAGVILEPGLVPNLRVSADWTRIRKTGNINRLSLFTSGILAYESYLPELVTRDAPAPGDPFTVGPIRTFDGRLLNFARAEIEALDFSAEYAIPTRTAGRFSLAARATRQIDNKIQLIASAPIVDNVGYLDGVKWRGNAEAAWDHGPLGLVLATTYYGPYTVGSAFSPSPVAIANQGNGGRVASQIYVDLFARYRFGWSSAPAPLQNLELSISARNLFNRRPPFDAGFASYYSPWGDPRMASFLVTLKSSF